MGVASILGIGLILLGAALGIVRLTDKRPRISDMGQNAKYSPGAHVFRVTPDNGHAAAQQKLTLCAKPGSRCSRSKR
jgi:hypothetical protein